MFSNYFNLIEKEVEDLKTDLDKIAKENQNCQKDSKESKE